MRVINIPNNKVRHLDRGSVSQRDSGQRDSEIVRKSAFVHIQHSTNRFSVLGHGEVAVQRERQRVKRISRIPYMAVLVAAVVVAVIIVHT